MKPENFELGEKIILSEFFDKFNKTLLDLRDFQHKLEGQISDLKNELGLKNQELSNILESLNSGLVVTDLTQSIIRYNRAACEITGFTEEQAKKIGLNQLLQTNIFPVQFDKEILLAYRNQPIREISYNHPTRGWIELELKIGCLYEKDGKEIIGILVHLVDITPLKKLEEIAQRQNRLAAMGQIAASVAHEIRNPLGAMELFVSMLKKDSANSPAQLEIVDHLQSAMRSMNHIITNILEYANPRQLSYKPADCAKIIQEFLAFYRPHAANHQIDLTFSKKAQNTWISADKESFKQLLLNLYMNALQAMPHGGNIHIEIKNLIEKDAKKIALFHLNEKHTELETIKMVFSDRGEGMSEEVKQKLFDPFFTTKQKGTGLGLSILRQITISHGGIVTVDSRENQGTQFTFQFPTRQRNQNNPLE